MGLNIPYLEGVAEHYLGWPVVVRVVPRDATFNGELDYIGDHWDIALNESLGAENSGQLAPMFFHEVGHARLGQMRRVDTGRGPGLSPDEWRQEYPGEEGEKHARAAQELEDEAWAWALATLAAYEHENGYGTFYYHAIIRGDGHD